MQGGVASFLNSFIFKFKYCMHVLHNWLTSCSDYTIYLQARLLDGQVLQPEIKNAITYV